jgi:hypothetical protein
MLAEMIQTYDELMPLKECGLTVELSWARAIEKKDGTKSPAITHGGYPALGLASKFKLQDRIHGKPDVRVTIDADWWDENDDQKRKALLFHELYHFEPKMDDTGLVAERDDAHRPKVLLRKHCVQVGWFYAVARRFGGNSQECIQFKGIVDEGGQVLLPGILGDDPAKMPELGTPLHQLAASVLRQQLEREEAAYQAEKSSATVQGDQQRDGGVEQAQRSQAAVEQASVSHVDFNSTAKAMGAVARRVGA